MQPDSEGAHYTHEVHLPQRKTGVADKPTHAHFAAEDYAHAPAAAAAAQQLLHARAPPPFAADERGPAAVPAPARFLQPHPPQQPSGKVGATPFGADVYSTSLQATAAARQQRFAAAAGAAAPFAVDRAQGGAAEASPIHFEKQQQKDPSVKVTEQQLASREAVEASCRQRQAEQQAARQKNWGSFVIG